MSGPLWGPLLEDFMLFMLLLFEQGLVLLFVSFSTYLVGPCGAPFSCNLGMSNVLYTFIP